MIVGWVEALQAWQMIINQLVCYNEPRKGTAMQCTLSGSPAMWNQWWGMQKARTGSPATGREVQPGMHKPEMRSMKDLCNSPAALLLPMCSFYFINHCTHIRDSLTTDTWLTDLGIFKHLMSLLYSISILISSTVLTQHPVPMLHFHLYLDLSATSAYPDSIQSPQLQVRTNDADKQVTWTLVDQCDMRKDQMATMCPDVGPNVYAQLSAGS